jgi:hypothetical protein
LYFFFVKLKRTYPLCVYTSLFPNLMLSYSMELSSTHKHSRPIRCTILINSLFLHVSATSYGHLQGATNFTEFCMSMKFVAFYECCKECCISPAFYEYCVRLCSSFLLEDGHNLWPGRIM